VREVASSNLAVPTISYWQPHLPTFEEQSDMTAGFGVFSPLFEASADYLVLLHLNMPEAKRVVTKLVEQCRLSSACHKEVGSLFDPSDWRPLLVGAVAFSALPYDQESSGKLWGAVDREVG
jgi:hypothetical protein